MMNKLTIIKMVCTYLTMNKQNYATKEIVDNAVFYLDRFRYTILLLHNSLTGYEIKKKYFRT